MAKRRSKWRYTVGERPNTVTVYERQPGGTLYARVWESAGRRWIRRSLGHRDQAQAKDYAHEQAAKLRKGEADIARGRTTLSQVFALYRTQRSPRKTARERQGDERRIELWTRVLGADQDPHLLSLGEWESFIDARMTGAIDPRGKPVPEGKRRAVRARAVEADCKWLRWVFNWATRWRTAQGHYLMRENPVRGLEAPSEKNPRRPVATQDRFEALRAVTHQHTMEVRWNEKRETRRSHLSELLDIANGTGRRISAIVQLRYEDLRLDVKPFGAIRWPAATDKTGRESVVPISPQVRAAVDRVLADRPGIGSAPLFPKPEDPTKPLTRHLADRWLREAEVTAGLKPLEGSLWHAYRRKWATERKHLPVQDVAAAGGWKTVHVVQGIYQQPDAETMLNVVLGAGELREVGR